jgi:hypothetical protein
VTTTAINLTEYETERAIETASATAQLLTETEIAAVSPTDAAAGRSEVVADAARLIAEASYEEDRPAHYSARTGDPLYGDHADVERRHAGVLLQLDQAESLGRIAAALEAAGQDTTSALGQIAGQLTKLTDAVDAHRLAVLDTAGDLRAEVEHLGQDVRNVDHTLECGLDDVRERVDQAVAAAEDRDRFSSAEAAWAAGRTALFFLVAAGAAALYGDQWKVPSGAAQVIAVYGGLIAVLAIVLAVVPAVTARWARGKTPTSAYPPFVEPDFTDDVVRSIWIDRVIAGDAEAAFDVEVALLQSGYPLDLAERRAELAASEQANRLPEWMNDWPPNTNA